VVAVVLAEILVPVTVVAPVVAVSLLFVLLSVAPLLV
jgi:hypothetical protein